MHLSDLFKETPVNVPESDLRRDVEAVWDDSRRVTKNSLFVALPGHNTRGDEFISQAIEKGATVILVQEAGDGPSRYPAVVFLETQKPREVFKKIVMNFFGSPSDTVRVIGVTGTNGKTTFTYLMEAILAAAEKKCGVVGTINYRVAGRVYPSKNTTPGLLDNQIFLQTLVDEKVKHAVMEVSSHALDQGRTDLIDFCGGVFTNLTGDHLDYHKTMEHYFEAKSRLFRGLGPQSWAVVNIDDSYGQRLVSLTRAKVITYGMRQDADVRAEVEEFGLQGSRIRIHFRNNTIVISTAFIGLHNVYNILAAFAAGLGEGIGTQQIKEGLESLHWIPGRLERVDYGQDFFIFIDYAHTDDGLKNVLESLQTVKHKRIIVVFGCGGDRDRTKRPRMGRIASDLADIAILTSDNPRSEDPSAIIQDIIPGFTRSTYEVVVDREKAIARALAIASTGDIVLLAGKGHETYQVLKDRTISFVERDIVEKILKNSMTKA